MAEQEDVPRGPSTPLPQHWLPRLGFSCMHVPGVSRAWRLRIDGGYVLITDLGGYDLPGAGEPASAYVFSDADDVLEFQEFLKDPRSLFEWIRSAERRARRRSQGASGGVSRRNDGGPAEDGSRS